MFWKLFTPAVKAVGGLTKTIFGDKSAREMAAGQADMAAQAQYASEFREDRNWFDSLIDGINRLVRPTLVFTVFTMFPMAYYNPQEFAILMSSLALIPEPVWTLFFLIVGFYLPSRMIEKVNIQRAAGGITKKQAAEVRKGAKEVLALRPEQEEIKGLPWLDNPSIEAWKKTQ
jgi:hypothetical protein